MRVEFPTQKIETKVDWKALFRQNGVYVAWFFVILLALGGLLTRMTNRQNLSLNDFYQANFQLSRLGGSGAVNESTLAQLLKDHPELAPKAVPYFIQTAVDRGEIGVAKNLAQESLKRLKYIDPKYLRFAATSLVVQEANYAQALEEAQGLQVSLSLEKEPKLYVFNAMRIGFLHRALGNDEEAMAQLSYVKTLLTEKDQGVKSSIQSEMISHLSSSQLTVFDLI